MRNLTKRMLVVYSLCVTNLAYAGPSSVKTDTTPKTTNASATISTESLNLFVEETCIMCHSDAAKTGGLTLESFDATRVVENAELTEKMIRKIRTGMMPPAIAPQPEPEAISEFVTSLELIMDEASLLNPNPGWRTFQRLNRSDYQRSVKDLVSIDVKVEDFLPPDTVSNSFDNVSEVQQMSATLLEGYMRAASQISRDAVGDRNASPTEATYKIPRTASQMEHVEGAPIGTRGGLSIIHHFPADGEYIFKIQLHSTPTGFLFGLTAENEKLEISINGYRKALLSVNPLMHEQDPNGMVMTSEPVTVKAGPQRISAAFIQNEDGPVHDLMAPIEHTLTDTTVGRAHGMTTLPHLRFFSINGPTNVTGVSETPSRREIFVCRPTSKNDELPCASKIITRLLEKAYRRPVDETDIEGIMSFYRIGSQTGGFENGIRHALQAILASPHFVFRVEQAPQEPTPEQTNYRISQTELASRLSFFIWGTVPDDELRELASAGQLDDPVTLETQVKRLLTDPRSETLGTRFASQWLRLQDVKNLHPDALLYPQYDHKLGEDLVRETQLFFNYIFKENRSILDIISADYTFANERLARHYQLDDVTGSHFRYTKLKDENRRGILGQGSVLTLTSIADRTSPVMRGKWILEVLLGSPPPPPPPDIPTLEEAQEAVVGQKLTVREAMEAHRSNPACMSCHVVIDPLGLALENFDVTGAWRIKDSDDSPIDSSGELYDGTQMDGPVGLRNALMKHSNAVITSFTESLLTYALGRRVEYFDMPTIRHIIRDAAEEDNLVASFILGVVKSNAFQMTRLGGTEQINTAQQ